MRRDEGYAETNKKFGGITQAIIDFTNKDICQELDAYYRRKSNLEVIGRHRRDLVHSRILAWLLDPLEFHGLNAFTLKKFLEACVLCQMETVQKPFQGIPSEVLDEIRVDQIKITSAEVFTEHVIVGGRIDVLVKGILQSEKRGERRLDVVKAKWACQACRRKGER